MSWCCAISKLVVSYQVTVKYVIKEVKCDSSYESHISRSWVRSRLVVSYKVAEEYMISELKVTLHILFKSSDLNVWYTLFIGEISFRLDELIDREPYKYFYLLCIIRQSSVYQKL